MKIENATKSGYNSLIDKCFYSLRLKKAIILGDCKRQKFQEMEDVLLDPLKSKSHIVATDLGDGRFAISFWHSSVGIKCKKQMTIE